MLRHGMLRKSPFSASFRSSDAVKFERIRFVDESSFLDILGWDPAEAFALSGLIRANAKSLAEVSSLAGMARLGSDGSRSGRLGCDNDGGFLYTFYNAGRGKDVSLQCTGFFAKRFRSSFLAVLAHSSRLLSREQTHLHSDL